MARPKSPARRQPDQITEKVCNRCGETKPVADYGVYYGGSKRSADGYRATCNACRASYSRQYRARAKDAAK